MADDKLKKNLNLFDVYAMSTGAMFSSGLFLLPEAPVRLTTPALVIMQ